MTKEHIATQTASVCTVCDTEKLKHVRKWIEIKALVIFVNFTFIYKRL